MVQEREKAAKKEDEANEREEIEEKAKVWKSVSFAKSQGTTQSCVALEVLDARRC